MVRDWMTARLADRRDEPEVAACALREPAGADAEMLAVLMLESYRGTVDDSGETIDDARREVGKLLGGEYGEFLPRVSLVFEDAAGAGAAARELAAATLVTRVKGEAFVAFSMTAPAWKRRGLARAGLARVMNRLRAAGETQVSLVVTRANGAAVGLYESLGFVVVPRERGG